MPDYREMYFKLVKANEEAIRILLAAQQECIERYLLLPEPELKILSLEDKKKRDQ